VEVGASLPRHLGALGRACLQHESSAGVAQATLQDGLLRTTAGAILIGVGGVVAFGLYVHIFVVFQLALAGAHGVPRWKGVLAGMLAFVAFSVGSGTVAQLSPRLTRATSYLGPHIELRLFESKPNFRLKWDR
jgi:hypothetical protein